MTQQLSTEFFAFLEDVASEHNVSDVDLATLRLALAGGTAKQIAKELGVGDAAIKKRLTSVYEKFEIPGTVMGKLERLQELLLEKYQLHELKKREKYIDEVPIDPKFHGREEELKNLKMLSKTSRIITIIGKAGMGKTSLAAEFMSQVQSEFNGKIIWYSLRTAPPINETIKHLIEAISSEHTIQNSTDILKGKELEIQIGKLINLLTKQRCLIILDNVESILSQGDKKDYSGYFLEGYEGYANLFTIIGELKHESCFLLTSREQPRDIEFLEIKSLPVQTLYLQGLNDEASLDLFKQLLSNGSSEKAKINEEENEHIHHIINHINGNPLSLKLITATIIETFDGKILDYKNENENVNNLYIENLIKVQVDRLSTIEKQLIYWLAIEREYTSIADLKADTDEFMSSAEIVEGIQSLRRRSLVEKNSSAATYTLQQVIMEYITDQLIEEFYEEIKHKNVRGVFKTYGLIKPTAIQHVVECQSRLILKPILNKIIAEYGEDGAKKHLECLYEPLREAYPDSSSNPGYTCSNLINLLTNLNGIKDKKIDSSLNFSNLCIKRADLTDVRISRDKTLEFIDANFSECKFTTSMDSVLSIAFNPVNREEIAASCADGRIFLMNISNKKLAYFKAGRKHKNWVRSVAFSSDGKLLATADDDYKIKLWDVEEKTCIASAREHTHWVCSVVFHPKDNNILLSGSQDGTIKIWKVNNNNNEDVSLDCIDELPKKRVWSLAFSPDGNFLASGSDDRKCGVSLWDTSSNSSYIENKKLQVNELNINRVFTVVFSPDSKILASAGDDGIVNLWSMINFDLITSLNFSKENKTIIRSIAFSDDGSILSVAGNDGNLKFWKTENKEWTNSKLVKTVSAHQQSQIWAVAFPPPKTSDLNCENTSFVLASSAEDKSLKLWHLEKEEPYKCDCNWELKGYTSAVWSIAFSPDDKYIVSGSDEYSVILWDISDDKEGIVKYENTKEGNTSRIWSVAFSHDGTKLASSSDNSTAQLWKLEDQKPHKLPIKFPTKLNGDGRISQTWSLAFDPTNPNFIAIGSEDHTASLWDIQNERSAKLIRTFKGEKGHTDRIWSIAFSPDGKMLASGSDDNTIKLWDINSGKCLDTLARQENPCRIWSVTFSPDGEILASANDDGKIDLWSKNSDNTYDLRENFPKNTNDNHFKRVWSIAFNHDGKELVSGGDDKNVKIWDITTGENIETFSDHQDWVTKVAFSHDGKYIASGSKDSTLVVSNRKELSSKRILKIPKPYDGMDITGATGITQSQIEELKALGAISNSNYLDS